MSIAKSIFNVVAPVMSLRGWQALAGSPLVLPYYHMVSDDDLPHVRPLYAYRSVRQFTADLEFLLKHYQPVALADLLAQVNTGKALPARAFLVTFDDGFREMAEIAAPILKAKGVPAAFFINSAFVNNQELCLHQKIALLIDRVAKAKSASLELKLQGLLHSIGIQEEQTIRGLRSIRYARRAVLDAIAELVGLDFSAFLTQQKPYLSAEQIRGLLHDGFAIGAHSIDHPFYGDLPLAEQLRQTRESMEFVQREFHLPYRAFAFPHSDSGVAREFFERSQADGAVEISFGTGGLLRDPWPRHFQRFSMEKGAASPRQLLVRQLARRAMRGPVQRPAVAVAKLETGGGGKIPAA